MFFFVYAAFVEMYLPNHWILCKFNLSCQQVCDENVIENPFSNFRIGQTVSARIVAKANKSENNGKNHQWELSIKPEMLTGKSI